MTIQKIRVLEMNFIKRHFLRKELIGLESKITRFYALSTWRTELENKQCNVIQKIWNGFLLNRANIEYDSLSPKIPNIEHRIHEIKIELINY